MSSGIEQNQGMISWFVERPLQNDYVKDSEKHSMTLQALRGLTPPCEPFRILLLPVKGQAVM
jgi:hypothetical protein